MSRPLMFWGFVLTILGYCACIVLGSLLPGIIVGAGVAVGAAGFWIFSVEVEHQKRVAERQFIAQARYDQRWLTRLVNTKGEG